MQQRISFDDYFMKIVDVVKLRATCPRKQVGAIVVKNNRIIATGYNGAPKGIKHCTEDGCIIKTSNDGKQHCTKVLHAEENALFFAGADANDGILYVNVLPCEKCFKFCIQSGIKKIIYQEDYNMQDLEYWVKNSKIEVIKWKN